MTWLGQMYLDRQEAAVEAAKAEARKQAERDTCAKAITQGVDNLVAIVQFSREEACRALGYTLSEYHNAQELLRNLAAKDPA